MTDQKNNPGLDEQSFSKLLEAAFVLQEHNRRVRKMEASLELQSEQLRQQEAASQFELQKSLPRPAETREDTDYTLTLAQIVEAQHQIQIRHLQSDEAMAVVAERIARMTHASGAGIAIQDGKTIRYHAGAGPSALPPGSEIPLEKAICAMCVKTGQVLRTPDVNIEFLFDPDLCHPRGIQSLVAVPVYHDGNIVGALELYFDRLQGFVEQDIHTCQLMAGLVTEAIGRASETALKKSMAAERSSMMAAIEKLQPNLTASEEATLPASKATTGPAALSGESATVCWKCGGKVLEEEQFCGKCGAPKVSDSDHASMQSKFASAWHMQQAVHGNEAMPPPDALGLHGAFGAASDAAEADLGFPHRHTPPNWEDGEAEVSQSSPVGANEKVEATRALASSRHTIEPVSRTLTEIAGPDGTWGSAAKARDFLAALAETQSPSALTRFWRARRGDFYLALAILLVAGVIRWGILSDHSVGATGGRNGSAGTARRRAAPNADLSAFDKFLIAVGLAEAPDTPEDKGNPEAQVWIDTHTALYYCQGSELYGKTANGRFASQRDAQLDQFESASRRACN